jgi:hypothetical protein
MNHLTSLFQTLSLAKIESSDELFLTMSSTTAQNVPGDLLVLPQAPRYNPACVRCTRAEYPTLAGGIYEMLASDCPWCSLLGKAILRVGRGAIKDITEPSNRFRRRPTSPSGRVRPDGFFLQVNEAVISIHYSNRRTFGHDVERIFLYTKLGHAECSGSKIRVARELQDPMATYKDIIIGWLETCHLEHSFCPKGLRPLPSRVLDVGSGQIRLHVAKGGFASYTALTYCWGTGVTMRTLHENYKAHLEGISITTLPQTLIDAIAITRALGIKYIWIDALCIIQDDGPDWEIESGNMAAIYQNAHLVISADSAADVNKGFLTQMRHRAQGVPIAFVENERATIYARSKHIHGNPTPLFPKYAVYPLQNRAWTLQEHVLANRLVHFTETEMIWECQSGLRCECMELDNGHNSLGDYSDQVDIYQRAEYNKGLASTGSAKFDCWYRVVSTLIFRKITKDLDVLPALSGLAQQMQKSGAGLYYAGIWASDLPYGLMWCPPSGSMYGRMVPYRAPSWSWASINFSGNIAESLYKRTTLIPTHPYRTICIIRDIQCTPSGKDPLGGISSGYLILSSLLFEATHSLANVTSYGFTQYGGLGPWGLKGVRSKTNGLGSILKFCINLDIPPSNLTQAGIFHCLILGHYGAQNGQYYGIALELKEKSSSPNTFERVGWFEIPSEDARSIVYRLNVQVVKIY